MMKRVDYAKAALKVREAMSGMRKEYHTTTSSVKKKAISASLSEMRSLHSDLTAYGEEYDLLEEDDDFSDEVEDDFVVEDDDMSLEDDDFFSEDSVDDDFSDDLEEDSIEDDFLEDTFLADDDTMGLEDDFSDDIVEDDELVEDDFLEEDDDFLMEGSDDEESEDMDELSEEDEILAVQALNLAAKALRAIGAASDDEEEDSDEEESEDDSDDSDAEDSDSDAEDSDSDEEEPEDDSEESEESDDDSEEGSDDEEEADPDEEDSSEEILSEEELKQLEDEGLVEGKNALAARLAKVQRQVATIAAMDDNDEDLDFLADEEEEDEAMPASYSEDAEETISTAAYVNIMASTPPAERAAIRQNEISALKMGKGLFRKMEKSAIKNRKKRKFRTKIKTSQKGKKAAVTLPGGKVKMIRKKYYFSTYDSKGNFLGTFWLSGKTPNKTTLEAYKKKYKVKHPGALPIVDPKAKFKKK